MPASSAVRRAAANLRETHHERRRLDNAPFGRRNPQAPRAEHDLDVNVRSEHEIEMILRHLEYQNTMLIAMVRKLGIEFEAEPHSKQRQT